MKLLIITVLLFGLSINHAYAITDAEYTMLAKMAICEAPADKDDQKIETAQVVLRRQKEWEPKWGHFGAKSSSIKDLLKSVEFESNWCIFRGTFDKKQLKSTVALLKRTKLLPSKYIAFKGHKTLKFRKSFAMAKK